MREIKFRAWNKADKEMFKVSSLGWDLRGNLNKIGEPSTEYVGTKWNDENLELMQFTGLHDRNGTEIYEGDIVKGPFYPHESNNEIGIVTFDEFEWPRFAVKSRNIYYNYPHDYRDCGLNEWVEVIGNIYENKELLEAEG